MRTHSLLSRIDASGEYRSPNVAHMSFTVTDVFVQDFSGVVRELAQQRTSRLSATVLTDNITGESAYLEQLAPTSARKVMQRHGDSPVMNSQHLRRRIAPYDYQWGDLVDKLDKVRMLIDPTSAYTRNAGFAMNRAKDDEIIGSCWATAFTGHSGSTSVTWLNGNAEGVVTMPPGTQIPVNDWTYGNGSGNAGLTISKLIYAMVVLDQAEGDDEDEERYVLIGGKQKGNLLATTEATLMEFGVAKEDLAPLREGKIARILGFNVLHSERNQLNGSSQARIPAWRKNAMGLGIARDIETRIAERPDKSFSWYVFASMAIGASRLEEPKLAEIICV